jgi:hypothetical protein
VLGNGTTHRGCLAWAFKRYWRISACGDLKVSLLTRMTHCVSGCVHGALESPTSPLHDPHGHELIPDECATLQLFNAANVPFHIADAPHTTHAACDWRTIHMACDKHEGTLCVPLRSDFQEHMCSV